MDIFSKQHYHFIGIGGIGISAIAKMLVLRGKKVTGSDNSASEITKDLESLGIHIDIGQNAENISKDVEVVIYTVAIPETNPELVEARSRGLLCITYPQALGELSRHMYTIAVSGTHGKTSTTAMIAHILQKAGLDPTVVVGSKMIDEHTSTYTNFIAGSSSYLVVEACEYRRSFLNLWPNILIINNVEADHLDYYKDIEDIKNAFHELSLKVPHDGYVLVRKNESHTEDIISDVPAHVVDPNNILIPHKIGVPGAHNIANAQMAIQAAELMGISQTDAAENLKTFKGTWRRLEYKGEKGNAVFYDDYAHHPTEITASLSALKAHHPDREIVCVFEPHQQSRTRLLLEEFAQALSLADRTFIAPIFITREIDDGITTHKTLVDKISKNTHSETVSSVEELKDKLSVLKKPLCVVLMGAGDIYKWTPKLIQ